MGEEREGGREGEGGVGGKHLAKQRANDACEKPQQAQRAIFTQFAMRDGNRWKCWKRWKQIPQMAEAATEAETEAAAEEETEAATEEETEAEAETDTEAEQQQQC